MTTTSLATTLPFLPLTIKSMSPQDSEGDVGVTFRPRIEFSRPVDPATLSLTRLTAEVPAEDIEKALGRMAGCWVARPRSTA